MRYTIVLVSIVLAWPVLSTRHTERVEKTTLEAHKLLSEKTIATLNARISKLEAAGGQGGVDDGALKVFQDEVAPLQKMLRTRQRSVDDLTKKSKEMSRALDAQKLAHEKALADLNQKLAHVQKQKNAMEKNLGEQKDLTEQTRRTHAEAISLLDAKVLALAAERDQSPEALSKLQLDFENVRRSARIAGRAKRALEDSLARLKTDHAAQLKVAQEDLMKAAADHKKGLESEAQKLAVMQVLRDQFEAEAKVLRQRVADLGVTHAAEVLKLQKQVKTADDTWQLEVQNKAKMAKDHKATLDTLSAQLKAVNDEKSKVDAALAKAAADHKRGLESEAQKLAAMQALRDQFEAEAKALKQRAADLGVTHATAFLKLKKDLDTAERAKAAEEKYKLQANTDRDDQERLRLRAEADLAAEFLVRQEGEKEVIRLQGLVMAEEKRRLAIEGKLAGLRVQLRDEERETLRARTARDDFEREKIARDETIRQMEAEVFKAQMVLKKYVSSMSSDGVSAQQELAKVMREKTSIEEALAEVRQQIAIAEEKEKKMLAVVDALRDLTRAAIDRQKDVERYRDELSGERDEMEKFMREAKNSARVMVEEIDALRRDLGAKEGSDRRYMTLKNDYGLQQTELAQLQKQINVFDEKYRDLEAKHDVLQAETSKVKHMHHLESQRVADEKNDMGRTQKQLAEENIRLSAKLKTVQVRTAQLRRANSVKGHEIEDLRGEEEKIGEDYLKSEVESRELMRRLAEAQDTIAALKKKGTASLQRTVSVREEDDGTKTYLSPPIRRKSTSSLEDGIQGDGMYG